MTVAEVVSQRRSSHKFLPTPVPPEILKECLSISQKTPSNNNIQPWQLTIAVGEPLRRLQVTLVDAWNNQIPLQIPPTPDKYLRYAQEHGSILYGPQGYNVAREDKKARSDAIVDNFNNYNAPCVAIFTIDKALATSDILSVGMYMQTIILLLSERGLATIPQVSIAGYPDLVRKSLNIGDDMIILCALAIGYRDEKSVLNKISIPRDAWQDHVTFAN